MVSIEINEQIFTVKSVNAPNKSTERSELFVNLCKLWIIKHSLNQENIFIGGDFNCCLPESDRNFKTYLGDKSREGMKDILWHCKVTVFWS